MKPGGSLLSQETATGPYPELNESSIHFLFLRSFQRIRTSPRPCVTLHNTLFSFCNQELLTLHQTPKLSTTPCRLFATAYLIHSQLSSISGGHLLYL